MTDLKSNIKRLYGDVDFLTSLKPARNYRNIASLNKAAEYIYDQLAVLEFDQLEYQEFSVKGGQKYRNISAIYKGKSEERIIVGAHYDVYEEYPGADDNASAVAGMLETARMLHNYRTRNGLKYTIEFVGYCLEEPPFFATSEMGSAIHAKQVYDAKVPVKLMICYEMIGYFSNEPNSQQFPHPALKSLFPDTGNFIIVAGNSTQKEVAEQLANMMQRHSEVAVYPVAFESTNGLVDLSDHRSYWKYGYPAVMINDTSFMRNPHYHMPSDTIDKLDFQKMKEVVNGVVGAITDMNEQ